MIYEKTIFTHLPETATREEAERVAVSGSWATARSTSTRSAWLTPSTPTAS